MHCQNRLCLITCIRGNTAIVSIVVQMLIGNTWRIIMIWWAFIQRLSLARLIILFDCFLVVIIALSLIVCWIGLLPVAICIVIVQTAVRATQVVFRVDGVCYFFASAGLRVARTNACCARTWIECGRVHVFCLYKLVEFIAIFIDGELYVVTQLRYDIVTLYYFVFWIMETWSSVKLK